MFPHSSFQTAGANPGPRTVSLDLPGLFKHPLRGNAEQVQAVIDNADNQYACDGSVATMRGCLKSPDSRQILSSMCSLQLPESWHKACTTFCELGRTFQTSSNMSRAGWRWSQQSSPATF